MHAREKLSIGLSYARAYGSTNEDIHFQPRAPHPYAPNAEHQAADG
jgi:hypothetical protein